MQAVAYSLRDRMIECFNDTNQYYLVIEPTHSYITDLNSIMM